MERLFLEMGTSFEFFLAWALFSWLLASTASSYCLFLLEETSFDYPWLSSILLVILCLFKEHGRYHNHISSCILFASANDLSIFFRSTSGLVGETSSLLHYNHHIAVDLPFFSRISCNSSPWLCWCVFLISHALVAFAFFIIYKNDRLGNMA